jgi:hypothetical protein
MTDRFTPDSWDEELDRQLREALSVAPSPAFRSRVRARLDAEPIPSAHGGMLSMGAAAAVIAAIVVAGTMSSRWWSAQSAAVLPASRAGLVTAVPYAAPVATQIGAAKASSPHAAVTRSAQAASAVEGAPRDPIVTAKFAPGDRAAFRLFVVLARNGALPVPESLPITDAGSETLSAIEVPPIEIPPVVSDAGEGVSQ